MLALKLQACLASTLLLTFVSPTEAQEAQWTFPKAGMSTKTIGDQKFYDLGNEFYAKFDTLNGNQIVIVVLRSDLGALIDNVNRERPGDIPNKDQFICAVAAEKALAGSPPGATHEYLGKGKLEGRDVYIYKARNGTIVGAAISNDKTFVLLMPHGASNANKERPESRPAPTPSKKTCVSNGVRVPCP